MGSRGLGRAALLAAAAASAAFGNFIGAASVGSTTGTGLQDLFDQAKATTQDSSLGHQSRPSLGFDFPGESFTGPWARQGRFG